jgi:hypothetical protein
MKTSYCIKSFVNRDNVDYMAFIDRLEWEATAMQFYIFINRLPVNSNKNELQVDLTR